MSTSNTHERFYAFALGVYVFFLLWLILFKFSADPLSVLAQYQSRSLSLVPFAGYSPGNLREMLDNLIVFIPLGLLVAMNFRPVGVWRKLVGISVFSAGTEIMQYMYAIGTTDITDIILNTSGGLVGLATYQIGSKCISRSKLDQIIVITILTLLVIFTLLRFLVFKVRY